jgi:hypothetical protein
VGANWQSPIDRLVGVGLSKPTPSEVDLRVISDGHLHSECDAICPRCLTWIEERDYVRQTAFGVLQHEVCPQRSGGPDEVADDLGRQRHEG